MCKNIEYYFFFKREKIELKTQLTREVKIALSDFIRIDNKKYNESRENLDEIDISLSNIKHVFCNINLPQG